MFWRKKKKFDRSGISIPLYKELKKTYSQFEWFPFFEDVLTHQENDHVYLVAPLKFTNEGFSLHARAYNVQTALQLLEELAYDHKGISFQSNYAFNPNFPLMPQCVICSHMEIPPKEFVEKYAEPLLPYLRWVVEVTEEKAYFFCQISPCKSTAYTYKLLPSKGEIFQQQGDLFIHHLSKFGKVYPTFALKFDPRNQIAKIIRYRVSLSFPGSHNPVKKRYTELVYPNPNAQPLLSRDLIVIDKTICWKNGLENKDPLYL